MASINPFAVLDPDPDRLSPTPQPDASPPAGQPSTADAAAAALPLDPSAVALPPDAAAEDVTEELPGHDDPTLMPAPPTPARPSQVRKHIPTPSDRIAEVERHGRRQQDQDARGADARAALPHVPEGSQPAGRIQPDPENPFEDDGEPRRVSTVFLEQLKRHQHEELEAGLRSLNDGATAMTVDTSFNMRIDVDAHAARADRDAAADPTSPTLDMRLRREQVSIDRALAQKLDMQERAARTAANITARFGNAAGAQQRPIDIDALDDAVPRAPATPGHRSYADAVGAAYDPEPAAARELPPRGTGVVQVHTVLTDVDRASMKKIAAELELSKVKVEASPDNRAIDGMPEDGHLRGIEPQQVHDFGELRERPALVSVTGVGRNSGQPGNLAHIASITMAVTLVTALQLMLEPSFPGIEPRVAPANANPATPGLLRALTFFIFGIPRRAIDIITSRRFWIINDIRLIAYAFYEPASTFGFTMQGLLIDDLTRLVALVRDKLRDPDSPFRAFFIQHRALIPLLIVDPLANAVDSVHIKKLVTFAPRSNKILVTQFNIHIDVRFLQPAQNRQFRIMFSNIVIRTSFFGTGIHVNPSWFCGTCKGSSHPTGLCNALEVPNWQPEAADEDNNTDNHLGFGQERPARGRGRGRGGRGGFGGRGGRGGRGGAAGPSV